MPAFQVRKNMFIRIHELPDTLLVALSSIEERDELLRAEPSRFFITPHYDGYPALLVRLTQVDLDELTELVVESWRICAPKRLLSAYDQDQPPDSSPADRRPTPRERGPNGGR